MDSLDEVRAGLRLTAASRTRWLKLDLRALDAVLAEPQPPGLLSRLVAYDANRRLNDPVGRGGRGYLRQIADVLREVLAEADQRHRRDES
jgi:hypothetical protein